MITPKPFSKFSPAPGNTLVQHNGLRGVGAADVSIAYVASTCQQRDASGLCIADVLVPDSSNTLPYDPGAGDAVAQWVEDQRARMNTTVLNGPLQQAQQSTGVCGALGIPCPTNIPAPFTIPSGLAWLFVIGVAAIVIAGAKK